MAKIISLVCVAVLTAADQIIKVFVERNLQPVGEMSFINGFIGWQYVRNTGAAFGMFSSNTDLLSIFTGIALSAGLIVLLSGKIKQRIYQICAVMIIAGGLGNLVDRVLRGYVVDYIEVQFTDFAVFNFADILVTCGTFLLMGYTIYEAVKEYKAGKAGDGNE